MIYKDYYRAQKGSKWHAFSRWLFDKCSSIIFPYGPPIPLIFGKMEEVKKEDIKKVLLICNGHIGDTIMNTSIFREIKKTRPDIHLTVICTKLSYPILEKNPYIDKIIIQQFKMSDIFWFEKKEKEQWKLLCKNLEEEKFDIAIAVRSDIFNIIFMAYMSDAKNTFGYYNLDGGKSFLTHPVLYPEKEMHASEADLKLVNYALGINATNNLPEIYHGKDEEKFINLGYESRYIVICPGACAKLQTWDKMKYKEIIEWIVKEYPEELIILAGGEKDKELIYSLLPYNKTCLSLIDSNIRRLGLIMNNADCVLLQDGGPMHIAYTMMKEADKRLIVLWGPNPLDHVRPLRGKIIHHKLPCYPCMRKEKECKMPEGKRCMDLISVEEVKKAIEDAICQKETKQEQKQEQK